MSTTKRDDATGAMQSRSVPVLLVLQRVAVAIQLLLLLLVVAGRAAGAIGDARMAQAPTATQVQAAFVPR